MGRINTSSWSRFRLGDLFDVEKGKRLTKTDMKPGNINYIGATAFNNGVTAKIGNEESLHPAGTITVCYNGSVGQSFYQTERFWATDDVNVLYPKFSMTQNIALFIIPLLRKIGSQYAYIDKWTQDKMEETMLPLPSISEHPDWDYMEQYIKGLTEKAQNQLVTLIENSTHKRNPINLQQSANWQKIQMKTLFEANNTGNILSRDVEDGSGTTPFVTASAYNNGVAALIDASKYSIISGHCILVGGKTFTLTYQKDDFVSNDSHNFELHLIDNTHSSKVYLFLITAIRATLKDRYEWSDAVTKEKLLDDYIYLPMTSSNNPDWDYMEAKMSEIDVRVQKNIDCLSCI